MACYTAPICNFIFWKWYNLDFVHVWGVTILPNPKLLISKLPSSSSFAVPGWKPQAMLPVTDLWLSKIYVYKVVVRQ